MVKYPPVPFEVLRGDYVYRNTGELSFETRPRSAGTFKVVFLQWVKNPRWRDMEIEIQRGLNTDNCQKPWYPKIINERGRIEVVTIPSLVTPYNM